MSYSQRRRPERPALSAEEHYRERRRRAQSALPIGNAPTLDQVADHERLIETFRALARRGGPAPGIDGFGYSDFGPREVADNCKLLAAWMRAGRYRPAPSRRLSILKSSGKGRRTLALRVVLDRVVSATLDQALRPTWESIFLPTSYGFRPGLGHHRMLADLIATMTSEARYVPAVDDVRDAFNHVPITLATDLHREHIQDKELLDLIERVLRGGEDQGRAVGVAQGDPYSPTALNVVLHHVHDVPFHGDRRHPFWFRYADNLVYLCQDVPAGRQAIEQSRRLLAHAGFALKGEDGPPLDLRDGDQARILGFALRLADGRPRLGLGESAWTGLREDLLKAHESENPPEAARATARGWLDDRAPACEGKTETVVRRALDLAARMGFRELGSPEELRRLVDRSLDRWRTSLRDALQRRGIVREGLVDHAGAPPPAVSRACARASERTPGSPQSRSLDVRGARDIENAKGESTVSPNSTAKPFESQLEEDATFRNNFILRVSHSRTFRVQALTSQGVLAFGDRPLNDSEPVAWTEQDRANRVRAAGRLLEVAAPRGRELLVAVEIFDPCAGGGENFEFEDHYDHVVECDLDLNDGWLTVSASAGIFLSQHRVQPGLYRVTVRFSREGDGTYCRLSLVLARRAPSEGIVIVRSAPAPGALAGVDAPAAGRLEAFDDVEANLPQAASPTDLPDALRGEPADQAHDAENRLDRPTAELFGDGADSPE